MWCGWKRPLNPIKLDIHTGWLVKWPRRCIFDVLPFFCFSQLESRENYLDQLYGSIMSSSSRQVHSNSKCAFGRKILVFSWGPCWQNLLDIWCSFRAFWETHETSRAKCRFGEFSSFTFEFSPHHTSVVASSSKVWNFLWWPFGMLLIACLSWLIIWVVVAYRHSASKSRFDVPTALLL